MTWTLALDLALAVLLTVTITYAALLNRKLGLLRRERQALDAAAGGLQETLARAEQNIVSLKGSADGLSDRVEKSRVLCNDLSFLIERGETLANGLEGQLRAAPLGGNRAPMKPRATNANAKPEGSPSKAAPAAAISGEARSEAEIELLKALGSAH